MKIFITLALFGLLGFGRPIPVLADDAAVASNQLLAAQLADAISTRVMLDRPNTFERDPLARPFDRTALDLVGAAVVTNVVARVLFRHAPTVVRLLTALEIGCTVNNIRVAIK